MQAPARALVCGLAAAAAAFALASPDVPLALAWGRAIADRGGWPPTNVLSATHGDWPVQLDKWLFQLGIYAVHGASGALGLVLLRVGLLVATVLLLARAARVRWHRGATVALLAVAAVAVLHRPYLRAELVTWLGVATTLALLPAVGAGDRRAWAALTGVQVLWANAHGYWVCGPLVLAAAALGRAAQPLLHRWGLGRPAPSSPAGRWALAVPLLALAACVTPYGWRTLAHPWRLAAELETADVLAASLHDFVRPWHALGTLPAWAALGLGAAAVAALVLGARRGRLRGDHAAPALLGLVLGFAWARNLPLVALCTLPLAVDAARWLVRRRATGAVAMAGAVPLAVSCLGLWVGWGPTTDWDHRRPGLGWDSRLTPETATAVLEREMPSNARLWNDLTSGGWLAWRLGPGRTYIDGNTDGYPLAFLAAYRATVRGATDIVAESERQGIDWFFARPDGYANVLARLATHPDLAVRAWEPSGAVLVRGGHPDPAAEARARADCRRWGVSETSALRAGETALADGDLPHARRCAYAAAWLRPDRFQGWALQARVHEAAGEPAAALAAAERALPLAPAGPERLALRELTSRLARALPAPGSRE